MSEKLYTVRCGTGCTCCAVENHTRGLYTSEEAAIRRIKRFESIPLLASQYSRTGRYVVRTYEVERLPDGRVIVAGERVVAQDRIFDVSEEGDLLLKGDKIFDGTDIDRLGDDYWP